MLASERSHTNVRAMTQAQSIQGLSVWTLVAGAEGSAVDLSATKGWSIQIDGDLDGGAVVFEASNNGGLFYVVDALSATGLHTIDDNFRWYRPILKDAGDNGRVTITIYTY